MKYYKAESHHCEELTSLRLAMGKSLYEQVGFSLIDNEYELFVK